MSAIQNEIQTLIHNDKDAYEINTDGTRIYYRGDSRNYFSFLKNCKFIIVYKPTLKVSSNLGDYTNTDNLDAMINFINAQNGQKFFAVDGKIETDSSILKNLWENYEYVFKGTYYYSDDTKYKTEKEAEAAYLDKIYLGVQAKIEAIEKGTSIAVDSPNENNYTYVDYDLNDFEIYIKYDEEFNLDAYSEYMVSILGALQEYEDAIYILVPICGILSVIFTAYLLMAIGHKKGKQGIELNDIDEIPIEIVTIILIIIIATIFYITDMFTYTKYSYYKLFISETITAYFVIYILIEITVTTIIKRIKAKTLIKSSLTWKILKLCKKILLKLQKICNVFTQSMSITLKTILLILAYILLMVIVIWWNGEFGIIIDIGITLYLIYQVIKRVNGFKKIETQLKKIYEGNNKERLLKEDFTAEFDKAIDYINDISNGFENAVEEGIKSERLKTELITNVSHDIKTPLTSIINYAELIKQENIENEKVKEYIEILLSKSHRLKRLTEDLVEASKASSGNVKLNLEKLNLGELINQTTGEFEDKLKERNLTVISKIPEEDIYIEADSRYMYRIIENIFGNISKYALENSRVYVDIIKNEDKVKLEVKNISAEKLNISEDELMQRFVRGDKSRTTEGSGLGLSISRSLAELQHGTFKIVIDGDLFKVELEFKTENS